MSRVQRLLTKFMSANERDFVTISSGLGQDLVFMRPSSLPLLEEFMAKQPIYQEWFDSSRVLKAKNVNGLHSLSFTPLSSSLNQVVSNVRDDSISIKQGESKRFNGFEPNGRAYFTGEISRTVIADNVINAQFSNAIVYGKRNQWFDVNAEDTYWRWDDNMAFSANYGPGSPTGADGTMPHTTTREYSEIPHPLAAYNGWILVSGPSIVGYYEMCNHPRLPEIYLTISVVTTNQLADHLVKFADLQQNQTKVVGLRKEIQKLRDRVGGRVAVLNNIGTALLDMDPQLSPYKSDILGMTDVVDDIDWLAINSKLSAADGAPIVISYDVEDQYETISAPKFDGEGNLIPPTGGEYSYATVDPNRMVPENLGSIVLGYIGSGKDRDAMVESLLTDNGSLGME